MTSGREKTKDEIETDQVIEAVADALSKHPHLSCRCVSIGLLSVAAQLARSCELPEERFADYAVRCWRACDAAMRGN